MFWLAVLVHLIGWRNYGSRSVVWRRKKMCSLIKWWAALADLTDGLSLLYLINWLVSDGWSWWNGWAEPSLPDKLIGFWWLELIERMGWAYFTWKTDWFVMAGADRPDGLSILYLINWLVCDGWSWMFLGRRVSRNPPGFPSPILIPPATGLKKEENYLRAGHFFPVVPIKSPKRQVNK